MMKLRSLLLTAAIIVAALTTATAQKEMSKADKLLGLKAFELAIKNYEAIVSNDPTNARAFAQLGEAYRMSNQPLEAIEAYEKAFELSDKLDDRYMIEYAHTLKRVGLYAQASAWYAAYSTVDAEEADYQITNIEYAKDLLRDKDKYDVVLFDANSKSADFGPAFYKDKLVFSSFRNDLQREGDKMNDSHINQRGNQLYITDAKKANDVAFLRADNKELYGIGPVSYSRDGRMVTYMRNNFTDNSTWVFSDESDMSIYYAFTDESGDFSGAKPFEFNQVEYSYAFPSLGFGGKAMYFASNRPGGFGGFDIYVSYFKDGKWSAPENLGEKINSKGNEITPYFDGETLYFSSDYRAGMGGYDVFSADVSDGSWKEAVNMGKGINSPADDYYAVKHPENGSFYFTTNRLGGYGKSDIYIAYPKAKEEPILAEVIIDEVPPAVDLNDLAEANRSDAASEPVLSDSKANPEVVAVSSSESVMYMEEEMLYDVSGATFMSAMEEESAEVFFIQLASLAKSKGNTSAYDKAGQYGRLYRFFKSDAVKIRLGYYNSKFEADAILPSVRSAGYRDAFVTSDVLSLSQFDIIDGSANAGSAFIDDYSVNSKYKVKLASYTDPLKFNVEGIKDAGSIEQWTKGQWTIFVLGGFGTLEEAQRARIKAVNRGWTDAELVVDEGGILRRVTTN